MEKIKFFIESDKGKDILVVFIIILVGIGSFSLGRLSKSSKNPNLEVIYDNNEANAIKAINSGEKVILGQNLSNQSHIINTNNDTNINIETKNFFASNRGSKYYSLECSGGKTIKQENRIYFNTREEAENAGYELSSSCK